MGVTVSLTGREFVCWHDVAHTHLPRSYHYYDACNEVVYVDFLRVSQVRSISIVFTLFA